LGALAVEGLSRCAAIVTLWQRNAGATPSNFAGSVTLPVCLFFFLTPTLEDAAWHAV